MRLLFLTYCIELSQGQLQIGVYKRGLRVALELCERGHEVIFHGTGHENFHDDLTTRAKSRMQFIDLEFHTAAYEGADENRVTFLARLRELRPDLVVIGEAPMAGPMLEMTLCAVEAKIPVVFLDNAYHPDMLALFCERHGSMVDGIVLSGPSVLHGETEYRYVVHVPPYVDASVPEARALLDAEFGAVPERLLLVLGYDPNVERLGATLLRRLEDPTLATVFVSRDTARTRRALDALPGGTRDRVRVIVPPADQVLFGLLQLARCAVTKCGYMQVTECFSLGTPVVTLYYPGFFSTILMPPAAQAFTHETTSPDADATTVDAARRFLEADAEALRAVHDGSLGAAAKTADFLEALPRTPRGDATLEAARLGFTPKRVRAALRVLTRRFNPVVREVRATHLRDFPDHEIYVVASRYSAGRDERVARMWGRLFKTPEAVKLAVRQARPGTTRRRVLFASARDRIVLEVDLGEEVLPSIVDLMAGRHAADG